MITEKQYKNALNIVDQYRKQLNLTIARGSSEIDAYEWLKAEMMTTNDITLEEFEEVLQMWINIKKKELSIAKTIQEC